MTVETAVAPIDCSTVRVVAIAEAVRCCEGRCGAVVHVRADGPAQCAVSVVWSSTGRMCRSTGHDRVRVPVET